jgi:hypothetical protein
MESPGETPPTPTVPPAPSPPRRRRPTAVAVLALVTIVLLTGVLLARRARREAEAQDMLVVQGVRRVCKLATVEIALADYARRTVPKTVDLPFTTEPEAYLFYSGVASAGFDFCEEPSRIDVDHAARLVRVRLPAPRLLSLDIKRFETINERSGFLNAIAPEDRNRWYAEARASLERAALEQGALERAQGHARELFTDFVERWGYRLELEVAPATGAARGPAVGKPR